MKFATFLSVVASCLAGLTSHAEDATNRVGPAGQALNGKGFFTVPDSQMVWGPATNFLRGDPAGERLPTEIRVGMRSTNGLLVLSGRPLKLLHPASVYLNNQSGKPIWDYPETLNGGVPTRYTGTNNIRNLYLPPENDRLIIGLLDASNKPVPMTSEGRRLGKDGLSKKIYWRDWGKRGFTGVFLLPWADDELYSLDPTKYFEVEKPGLYKLTVTQRLYMIDTNTCLKAITLPPVTVVV